MSALILSGACWFIETRIGSCCDRNSLTVPLSCSGVADARSVLSSTFAPAASASTQDEHSPASWPALVPEPSDPEVGAVVVGEPVAGAPPPLPQPVANSAKTAAILSRRSRGLLRRPARSTVFPPHWPVSSVPLSGSAQ